MTPSEQCAPVTSNIPLSGSASLAASFAASFAASLGMLRAAAVALICLVSAAPLWAVPPIIDNPAEPAQGRREVKMVELWRAGGEDDEIFFGNISAVRSDEEGKIYLLDSQLSEVHVYSPEGEHLRVLGREGEGPGEFQGSNDIFVDSDGTVCVLQGFPGKIVKIAPDGTPAGQLQYGSGGGGGGAQQGQFGVLVRGLANGQKMVLAGIRMTFGGGAQSTQTYFLDRCDEQAVQQNALLEKIHVIDYSDFALDDAQMDFIWSRMAIGPDGRVYAAPAREEYAIQVFGADSMPERIIKRQYTSLERSAEQKDIQRKIIEGVGANYPVPPKRISVEDNAPDISGLWVDEKNQLWVTSSRGTVDQPPGTFATIDVFSPGGEFSQQVALQGPGDPEFDALYFVGQDRVVVVTDALSAFLSQMAVSADEATEEAEPLEVICSQLQ